MFARNLNTLVLRGVAVVNDGVVVGARFGFSYPNPRTPAQLSTRPSRSPVIETVTLERDPEADTRLAGNHPATRAGRPGCPAGVLSPKAAGRLPAGSALLRWSRVRGGSSRTAAMRRRISAPTVATVGKIVPVGIRGRDS